jgi:hypothetical protein
MKKSRRRQTIKHKKQGTNRRKKERKKGEKGLRYSGISTVTIRNKAQEGGRRNGASRRVDTYRSFFDKYRR